MKSTYLDQKCNKNSRRHVGLPVYRRTSRPVTSRCCTHESVRRGGCKIEVERGGENRGRGIYGQGDGGGSENVRNGVCCIILRVVKEKDMDAAVGRVKEVDEDDHEGGEDVVGIHGGRCEEGVGTGESGFIYPWNTGAGSG